MNPTNSINSIYAANAANATDGFIKYLVLDPNNKPLAHCRLAQEWDTGRRLFTLLEPCATNLTQYDLLHIISLNAEVFTAWAGRVEEQRKEQFTFQPTAVADENLRRNLRVDLRFTTYLYSLQPTLQHSLQPIRPRAMPPARIPVLTYDISCGGIALFAARRLAVGDIYSIVIPLIRTPLMLPIRILRTKQVTIHEMIHTLYACEFYDLLPQEEALLRETIFDYQLKHQKRRRAQGS